MTEDLGRHKSTGFTREERVGLQQTNLAREHPSYLNLNLQAEGVCGLQQSAALFKIRAEKINVAVKVYKRSIMICIFYKDVLDIF